MSKDKIDILLKEISNSFIIEHQDNLNEFKCDFNEETQQIQNTEEEQLNENNIENKIEAVLFVASNPVSISHLKEILEVDEKIIKKAINELKENYQNRALKLEEVAGGWQLRTKSQYSDVVLKYLKAKPWKLSNAANETLAIIAYKQPITKAEIEQLRGVDCSGMIKQLMEVNLIKNMGRKPEPGRPLLYGTTQKFLEIFGLNSLKDLPSIREIKEFMEEK